MREKSPERPPWTVLMAIAEGAKLTDPDWRSEGPLVLHNEAPVFAQLSMKRRVLRAGTHRLIGSHLTSMEYCKST